VVSVRNAHIARLSSADIYFFFAARKFSVWGVPALKTKQKKLKVGGKRLKKKFKKKTGGCSA
jgi:hypothetical protein